MLPIFGALWFVVGFLTIVFASLIGKRLKQNKKKNGQKKRTKKGLKKKK